MRSLIIPLLATAATVVAIGAHGADVLPPNANLKADGLPPIPAELAVKVAPYTEFKPATAVSWHPQKRELVVARRAGNTTQLHRVAAPGADLAQLTDYAEPVRYGGWWPKAPSVLVFARDAGGNEQQQVYRLDADAREPVLLTDAARRNEVAGITHARDRLLVGLDGPRQDRPPRRPDDRPDAGRPARSGETPRSSPHCPAPDGAMPRSRSTTGVLRSSNTNRSTNRMSG